LPLSFQPLLPQASHSVSHGPPLFLRDLTPLAPAQRTPLCKTHSGAKRFPQLSDAIASASSFTHVIASLLFYVIASVAKQSHRTPLCSLSFHVIASPSSFAHVIASLLFYVIASVAKQSHRTPLCSLSFHVIASASSFTHVIASLLFYVIASVAKQSHRTLRAHEYAEIASSSFLKKDSSQ